MVTASNSALEKAEEIQERAIQAQALEHVPKAIEALGKFSRGEKVGKVVPNSHVVRSSARDIIEFAGGRPETRDPRIGDGARQLTIVIARFGDGSTRTIDTSFQADVTPENDPIAIAEDALRSVSKAFEVPDAET